MSLFLIPLLGALLILAFVEGQAARLVSLVAALANFAVTVAYLGWYNPDGQYLMLADWSWIPQAGIHFKLGFDGTGLALVLLTNLLTPLIILSSWSRSNLNGSFYGLVLLMQAALIGVFTALDGIVFYVFWELALIPIYFICAVWGGENRVRITLKFFIYTFVGSLFMLLALIYLQQNAPGASFDWADLMKAELSPEARTWVLLAFFLAFAIKMPVFPFHTWQPDTYTVAPTGGAMLLSGIMLKMGIFGVMRWMLPLGSADHLYPIFIILAITGIVYGSLIAIRLQDIKRIIAYSSIAHVGLIAAGVFANNETSLQGAILQMLNHGINIVGLFLVSDIIENRTKTRQLNELGGIAKKAPVFATLFMIIMLGTVAVPLTNGFAGELLLLKGLYEYHFWAAVIAGLTIILCAVYMLRVYQFAMFGKTSMYTEGFEDVRGTELIVLGVIAALVLLLGVYPQPVLDLTGASTSLLLEMK